MSGLTAASLFSGIGGFDVALGDLGVKVAVMAENAPGPQSVLRARFPDVRLHDDATTVDMRGVDIVTAGFPCQGISSIGAVSRKARGVFDPNSASYVLWAALQRIADARPEYVLLENARDLAGMGYTADLAAVLKWFSEAGYYVHVIVLNAGCYGSHMRRERAFVLARRRPWSLPDIARSVTYRSTAMAIGVTGQNGGAVWCAQPSVVRKSRSYTLMVLNDEVRTLLPACEEVLFGLPVGWTEPAKTDTARYDALGNAVSVDCARAALQLLLGENPLTRAPDGDYRDLYDLTVAADGGAAGATLGRIARTGKRTANKIELAYCVPVYVDWLRKTGWQDLEMVEYARVVTQTYGATPRPWPRVAEVQMTQPGPGKRSQLALGFDG